MWFTERGTSKLGRVTTSGSITEVDAPPPQGSLLTDVTTGPDRALSFTRDGQVPPPTTIESFLSRYDIATGTFTQFAVGPSSNQAGVTSSGGRLWVAMRANDEVDAFTPDGAVIERISLNVEAGPQNVLRPANGDVWVTEPLAPAWPESSISRRRSRSEPFPTARHLKTSPWVPTGTCGSRLSARTTSTSSRPGALTSYHVPTPDAQPYAIATGPDGAVGGVHAPTPHSTPYKITSGPDGRVWFSDRSPSKLGAIDPNSHAITEYPLPDSPEPNRIVTGPDGRVWYAGFNDSSAGAVTPNGDVTRFPNSPFPLSIAAGPDKQGGSATSFPPRSGRCPLTGSPPITST